MRKVEQKKEQKKPDFYRKLKHVGYRMSVLSSSYSHADLIRYAKFYLAIKTKTLVKDPVWDDYTEPELLAEFYAHQFIDNPEFLTKFENELGLSKVDEFAEWADRKIEEEKKVREKLMGETEDNISFSPDTMGDS